MTAVRALLGAALLAGALALGPGCASSDGPEVEPTPIEDRGAGDRNEPPGGHDAPPMSAPRPKLVPGDVIDRAEMEEE